MIILYKILIYMDIWKKNTLFLLYLFLNISYLFNYTCFLTIYKIVSKTYRCK